MSLHLNCPTCDEVYTLPDELLGRTFQCKKCFKVFAVVAVAVSAPWGGITPSHNGHDTTPSEDQETKQAPKKTLLTALLRIVAIVGVLLLLVAIGIVSFTTGSREPSPADRAAKEINQLDAAITAFMQKYGVEYPPPSQLSLHQNYNTYRKDANQQLAQESANYVQKTIGKNSPGFMTKWKTTGIRWVSDLPDDASEILEGHQCLVFFLGGLVQSDGQHYHCVGLSTDATNPDAPPQAGVARIGPFFAFDSNRLSIPPNKTYFPAYLDAYSPRTSGQSQYYAYFSSYKHTNGYNRYGGTDCPSLNVWPYASSPMPTLQFVRPNDWQIICAGADGIFGPGTNPNSPYYWNANTAAQIPAGGADDQANFATGKLQSWP